VPAHQALDKHEMAASTQVHWDWYRGDVIAE